MHEQKKGTKGFTAVVVCQVAECQHTVPLDKVYYRRYKICPFHSSLPAMVLGGRTMRWCQQCGRFQGLEEFEGERRSCKRTLEQHNARRRRANQSSAGSSSQVVAGEARKAGAKPAPKGAKPSPVLNTVRLANRSGLGAGFSPFSAPSDCPASTCEGYPSGHGSDSSGDGAGPRREAPDASALWQIADMSRWNSGTSGTDSTFYHPHDLSSPLPPRTGAGWSPTSNVLRASASGPTVIAASDDTRAGAALDMVMEQLRGDLELQDMLALMPDLPSLDCPSATLSDILLPEVADRSQALFSSLTPVGLDELGMGMGDMDVDMLELAPVDLMLPAGQRAPAPSAEQMPFTADVVTSLQSMQREYMDAQQHHQQQQQQQQQQLFGGPAEAVGAGAGFASATASQGVAFTTAAPAMPPPLPWLPPPQQHPQQQAAAREDVQAGVQVSQPAYLPEQSARVGSQSFKTISLSGTAVPPSPMEMQQSAAGDGFLAQEHMVRVSLKLFNITPDQLPEQLRQDVANLVSADPIWVDTFVRPGCTHLTVVAMLSAGELQVLQRAGAEGLAQQLLRRGGWGAAGECQGEAWAGDMLVQLGSEVAIVKAGRITAVVNMRAVAPMLLAARPVAVLASSALSEEQGGSSGASRLGEGVVTLWGCNISGSHDVVVCRQSGRVLDLEVIARGKAPPSATRAPGGTAPAPEWVLVRPLSAGVGLLQFEVQRGGMLSAPALVVALPSRLAVAEAQLAFRTLAGTAIRPNFLRNLGLVLSHQCQPSPGSGTSRFIAALALRLLTVTRSHGWQELSSLLWDVLALGHMGAPCTPMSQLRCAVRSAAADGSGAAAAAAQPHLGAAQEVPAAAAEGTSTSGPCACAGSPMHLTQLLSERHSTPSCSSWDAGVHATNNESSSEISGELHAAGLAEGGEAGGRPGAGPPPHRAADQKLGGELRESRAEEAGAGNCFAPCVLEGSGAPSGSAGAEMLRTEHAVHAEPEQLRQQGGAQGERGTKAAAGLPSAAPVEPSIPSTSSSMDLGPKPKASRPGKPGPEDAAMLAARLLAMQLDAAEAEEEDSDEGELSDGSNDEGAEGVLPPPEKVGGFPTWVALQMSGGGRQRRREASLADRLASLGSGVMLATVAAAAGAVLVLRGEYGEA